MGIVRQSGAGILPAFAVLETRGTNLGRPPSPGRMPAPLYRPNVALSLMVHHVPRATVLDPHL